MRPAVVWLTGLPGSGKTTIGTALRDALATRGLPVDLLDGDALRAHVPTGFTKTDRDQHVRRVALLASRLEHHGVTAVCALVSPYAETRRVARGMCGRFIEVHVATPLAVCEQRDPKGMYARARRGDIPMFTGVSDPYEPPDRPELSLDTSVLDVTDCVAALLHVLEGSTSC